MKLHEWLLFVLAVLAALVIGATVFLATLLVFILQG